MAVQVHVPRQNHPSKNFQDKLESSDGSQEPLKIDRVGKKRIHAEKAVGVQQPPPVAGQRGEGRIGLEIVPAEVEQVRLKDGGCLLQGFKPPGCRIGGRWCHPPGGQSRDGPVDPHTLNCRGGRPFPFNPSVMGEQQGILKVRNGKTGSRQVFFQPPPLDMLPVEQQPQPCPEEMLPEIQVGGSRFRRKVVFSGLLPERLPPLAGQNANLSLPLGKAVPDHVRQKRGILSGQLHEFFRPAWVFPVKQQQKASIFHALFLLP
ncbi:hypothetical protein SDC9_119138 [bioreactor metagenome]|uniref:Uncharacterized protein n=1 Tax=bioreactor metagenome TaxID=1076179 RepID=A0A645C3P5_9ZZZZ